jgi:hypothetical protein
VLEACAPSTLGTWPLIASDSTQTHWAVTSLTVTKP